MTGSTFTTKSGAYVQAGEPMSGGYTLHGKAQHIADDYGSLTAVCGVTLAYQTGLRTLQSATCKRCRQKAALDI